MVTIDKIVEQHYKLEIERARREAYSEGFKNGCELGINVLVFQSQDQRSKEEGREWYFFDEEETINNIKREVSHKLAEKLKEIAGEYSSQYKDFLFSQARKNRI